MFRKGWGLGRGFSKGGAASAVAEIITQDTPATFGPYVAGMRPTEGYIEGTYDTTADGGAATIVSIVPSWTINGSAADGDEDLVEGDDVGLLVLVTDSEANERTFNYGIETVAAPTADFTVSSNAEMTALMAAEGVSGLSGATIAIEPGVYDWDSTFWNNRAYTSLTTFVAADETDRPVFRCGINYGTDFRNPTNVRWQKLKLHSPWIVGVNTADQSSAAGIRLLNNISNFRVEQCEFYGDLLEIVQANGFPASMDDIGPKGLFGADGATRVVAGGFYITDCIFHGARRNLQLPPRAATGGGPTEIIGCTFYDQGVDALFISGYQHEIKINWNHFYGPLNGWDGSDIAVTCDPTTNRFTSAAPHGLTGTTTVNLSPNMFDPALPNYSAGTAPAGIGETFDFTVVRIDDTTLQINDVDPTTAGSNVRIYREPAHADFIQSGALGNATTPGGWDSGEIIGNTITVGRLDSIVSKRNCQTLFMGTIANATYPDTWHYNNVTIAGNLIFTDRASHGISVYNAWDSIICNNVLSGLDDNFDQSPPIGFRQQYAGTSLRNKIAGNIVDQVDDATTATLIGNVLKSEEKGNIDEELVETVLEPVTRAQMIAYFTILPDSDANTQSPKAGGPGTGYIDYDARTYSLPAW